MNIYITRTKKFESSTLKKVWELLVLHEGPMKFSIVEKPVFFEQDDFVWSDLFESMQEFRKQHEMEDADFFIVLTELSNNQNWFSAFDEKGFNNIFIHGRGWENFIYCDSIYPLAYQVLSNVLQRILIKDYSDLEHTHEPAIGCMNDMCSWKPDITFKLRTGDICADCLQWAKDKGISDEIIQQVIGIFNLLRLKMLHNAGMQSENVFDQHLPFNVAITKRKISSTSEPLRKFLFLIDHFDSLIRTAVLFWATLNYQSKEDRKNFFDEFGLTQRPSLGTWIKALQALTKKFQKSAQLNSSINNKLQRIIEVTEKKNIVKIRNEMRGHGYIECNDNSYQKVFNEFEPIITEIEELLNSLFTSTKLRYINSSTVIDDDKIEISSLELTGSYAVYTEKQNKIVTSNLYDVPIGKHVYIYNTQNAKWYNLKPFFIFDNCPVCKHQRLLIFDSEDMYLDPLEGHRVQLNYNS